MNKLFLLFLLIVASCKTPTSNDKETKTTSNIDEAATAITLKGTVSNHNGMAGDINIMGYFVQPEFYGALNQDGSFEIRLPEDFDKITTKAFNTYNSSDVADYQLNYNTALESFPNAANVSFSGKESRLAYVGKYYRFEVNTGDRSAYLYPASSENFVKYVVGTKDAVPETGFNYYYIYAKEPFSIDGNTTYDNLFEDGTEEVYTRTDHYDLNIKKGWNLLRYEINQLEESSSGTQEIAETTVSNAELNSIPESWFMSAL
ncbi:hypothetical protein LX97_02588 [Nonlabens dokdonensis]|jgi:hypothetical protein|uniref:Lipoprotein n=2 Tax=Nonlabens dokdonensis TaxID=328515 RepID=L7WFB8_NONDD|nr:hypothetical protein [Nonlabens dokdonensis]AGC78651.1 hypothetical protein DDD_3524 [Nonlabens dokdonensis DSW-6]PZX39222.1 hypothetical protein LX97_02588 [Nonlabens dokdonensis]